MSRRKMTMLTLFTYEDGKRLAEERRRRALAKHEATRTAPNDTYVRAHRPDADIIELTFGTACPDSIGA
ncbi:MAG TPA: hypothetical protein VEB69_00580 [Acidimicrobiia bacterium]|nr:hypothetical protein [Acidimicrobiia bacterium]